MTCYICDAPLAATWFPRGDRSMCSRECLDAFALTTMNTIPVELLIDIRATTTPERLAKRAALRQHVDNLLDGTESLPLLPKPSDTMHENERKREHKHKRHSDHSNAFRRCHRRRHQRGSLRSSRRGFIGGGGSAAWTVARGSMG